MASIISAGTTDSTSLNVSGDKTGILQLASNNAVTAVTIDASQNVGIGTTSPAAKFHSAGGVIATGSASAFTATAGIMDTSGGNARLTATGADASTYGVMTFNRGSSNASLFQENMRIDSSGNVGIGTSSPSASGVGGSPKVVQIYNSGTSVAQLVLSNADTASGAYPGVISFVSSSLSNADKRVAEIAATKTDSSTSAPTGALTFNTSGGSGPVERMRITSGGELLIGKTVADDLVSGFNYAYGGGSGRINITSTGACGLFNRQGSDGILFYLRRSNADVGSISVTTTATAFNTSSDYRLKDNIAPMTGALNKVAQLKPVTYRWKADGSDGEGFIAHELAEVKPHAVTGVKDAVDADGNPVYQGIDTSFLVATLTAAIQEQQAIINTLTARIVALENK